MRQRPRPPVAFVAVCRAFQFPLLGKAVMEFTLILAVLSERGQRVGRRIPEILRREKLFLDEIVNEEFLDRAGDGLLEPNAKFGRRAIDGRSEKGLRMPPDPSVTLADLDDRASDGADANDGMERPRPVPDEKSHPAAGGARVLVRPSMPEIPPNVLQSEAGVLANLSFFHELQIRPDSLAERLHFLRFRQIPRGPE